LNLVHFKEAIWQPTVSKWLLLGWGTDSLRGFSGKRDFFKGIKNASFKKFNMVTSQIPAGLVALNQALHKKLY